MAPLKGLAFTHSEYPQDRTTLAVSWWYDWGTADLDNPAYVPMLRSGLEQSLADDYAGDCLLFNEWDSPEPYGIGISTCEALCRYCRLLERYPKTRWIVGGASSWAYRDLVDFHDECLKHRIPLPERWHIHAYVKPSWVNSSLARVKERIALAHEHLSAPLWVTEFGCPDANTHTLANFRKLSGWLMAQTYIERIAAYTNRMGPNDAWNAGIGKGVGLIDWDSGELTPVGAYYASL